MKRFSTLLLAAGLLLPGSFASAQTTFSVHGGLNLSIFRDYHVDSVLVLNRERTTGPNVGIAAAFKLSPPDRINSLSLQVSGNYSPKGSARSHGQKITTRLDYLEITALLDIRIPLIWGPLAVHVSAGPGGGWMMTCEFELQNAEGVIERTTPCADDEFRSFDFGLVGGGSLEIGVTETLGITVGFQYNHGLGFIDHFDEGSLKNRTLSLRAGLLYPIG